MNQGAERAHLWDLANEWGVKIRPWKARYQLSLKKRMGTLEETTEEFPSRSTDEMKTKHSKISGPVSYY